MTSHDVVLAARRSLGVQRIGHTGTLDPFASGLLVLLVGRATRLLPYVAGEPKEYLATIRFGTATDTDDFLGTPLRTAQLPDAARVRQALPRLTGAIDQVPPAYSAKRVAGRRAYEAARAGQPLVLLPVPVHVYGWEELAWRGREMDARITCSGGTYVRALARDLGALVGSAAHLSALRRTRVGPFRVEDAASLGDIRHGTAVLLPPLRALCGIPCQSLKADETALVARGIGVPATIPGAIAALVRADTQALVALAERRGARWQPRVVMHRA